MSNDLENMWGLTQAMRGGKVCRHAIEIPADEDKHEFIFLGLWPLIRADAIARGMPVMWLAPDGNSRARAHNKLRQTIILDPVEFATWDYLEPIPENNFQITWLGKFWIIGDLDWSGPPIQYQHEHVVNAVKRVLATDSCPALLVHQHGKTSVVPFPPKFEDPSRGFWKRIFNG